MTGFFVRRDLGISTGFPSKPTIGGAAAAFAKSCKLRSELQLDTMMRASSERLTKP
jgi:hypothetical protein